MAFTRTAVNTTGNTTSGSTSITNVASTTGMFVGMMIYGTNIRPDTVITGISGTTVTMDKTALATATATPITGQYIIQSGTDTTLAGLNGITGVTTINANTTNRRVVYDLGLNQLRFQGTVTHDPDEYEIVSNVRNGLSFESGCNYTYGIERVVNGRKTYSKGTGLVSTYVGDFFTLFGVTFSGTHIFNWYGGVLQTFGPISQGGAGTFATHTFDAVWRLSAISCQFRSTGTPTFNALTVQGIGVDAVFFLAGGWNAFTINYERTYYQTPAGGGSNRTILNPQFANNQADADLRANQASGTQQVTTIKNPDVFPRLLKLSSNAYADFPVVEALSLSISDSTNTAVGASEAIAYIKDSNNGARINSQVTNYVNDRTYIASSVAGGGINLGDILTLAGVNTDLTTGTINLDYRGNYGNNNADFNVYIGGYKFNNAVTKQSLLGNNGKNVAWTLFEDLNVTLSRTNALAKLASSFTVNPTTKTITVTANSTYDDLYDIAKAYKYNGTQLNAETPTISDLIIKANGSNLEAYTGWSLVVNNGVTLSSGVKFDKIKFDTITNNGLITGVYQDNTGTSTVLTISGFDAGSTVYVEDNLFSQKFYQTNVTDSEVVIYIPPTATGSWYYAVEKYGNQRQSDFFTFSGGFKDIVVKALEDTGISDQNQSTVASYTQLNTPDKIYDYVAYLRTTTPHISFGQIVFKDGTALDLQGSSMIVNQNASAVGSYNWDNQTLTIKTLVLDQGERYDLIKATPPATITAVTNEIINVLIEDANGDSKLNILGGDNLGYELWKVTTATATDDYATGTLLTTLPNNTTGYRFIGITGFDIVGRDISSGVRRRSSMLKGVYNQAFYVGDQIQLATNAPQLEENNQKLDELILKTDTNLDVKVSTRLASADYINPATPQNVLDAKAEVLTAISEIPTTDISGLALEATAQSIKSKVDTLENADFTTTNTLIIDLGTPLQSEDYIAPDNVTIGQIKSKVDTLENTDLTGIATATNVTDAKNEIIAEIENIDVDLTGLALEETSQEIKTKVLTLENYDDATAQGKLDDIKSKVDTLENTDLTSVTEDLTIINNGVKKASLLIPHTDNL